MALLKTSNKAWMIRFKLHRTTLLLYVEPTQKLSTIKTELLAALREAHPMHVIKGAQHTYQIPENIEDIQLAKMVELDSDTVSWQKIDSEEDAEHTSAKGKGKATMVNGAGSKETAQSVGLTEGSVVAVRFSQPSQDGDQANGFMDNRWDVLFANQGFSQDQG